MERLCQAAEEHLGITAQAQLARALGLTQQVLNNWNARGISDQGKLLAQSRLGISADWISSGTLPVLLSLSKQTNISTVSPPKVPLLKKSKSLVWLERQDLSEANFEGDYLMTDLDLSKQAFGIDIDTDEMAPDFKEGDRIILDPSMKATPGDFVLALVGDEIVFRKYRHRTLDSGVLITELVAQNPDYPTLRSDAQEISVVGVMAEHRKYRRSSRRK
jgi:SOS-response transcriptional repressor LexA